MRRQPLPSRRRPGQPKPGGTLRVSAVGDVANIDAQSWGPRNGFSIFMAYDTLTTYDLDLKPQPQLAESWEQTPDGKQFTVNLRKGVQFHSGRELTSEDVAKPRPPARPKLQTSVASFTILPGFIPTGTTFEAKDKYTVVIKSPVAWPIDLRLLPGPAHHGQGNRLGPDADHQGQSAPDRSSSSSGSRGSTCASRRTRTTG